MTRSSRPEEVCKKGVLKSFGKFLGKHQCWSLFFIKVASLMPATFLKKRLQHRCFPLDFAKFLRTPFFTVHLRRLLLFDLEKICGILNMPEPMTQNNFDKLSNLVNNAAKAVAEKSVADDTAEIKKKINLMLQTQLY